MNQKEIKKSWKEIKKNTPEEYAMMKKWRKDFAQKLQKNNKIDYSIINDNDSKLFKKAKKEFMDYLKMGD